MAHQIDINMAQQYANQIKQLHNDKDENQDVHEDTNKDANEDNENTKYKSKILNDIILIFKKEDVDNLMIESALHDSSNYILFHKITSKYITCIDKLVLLELLATQYYKNYEISSYFKKTFKKYVNEYVDTLLWESILIKIDYSYYIFKKRRLPYVNVMDPTWKKINIDSTKEEYNFNNDRTLITSNSHNCTTWDVLDFVHNNNIDEQVYIIKNLFKLGLIHYAVKLFIHNLMSPVTCHIIKNKDVWKYVGALINVDKQFYDPVNYGCCYAMYILKHEELIVSNKINQNHRFVFTIDEATNLPNFSNTHIENSPYVMQIIGEKYIADSCIFRLVGNRKINTKEEFLRRFHLLTGGAFENINLKEYSASITGSILIPCAHVSPLEELFKNSKFNRGSYSHTPNDDFLNYSEYYYPSYDSLNEEEYYQNTKNKKTPNVRLNGYVKEFKNTSWVQEYLNNPFITEINQTSKDEQIKIQNVVDELDLDLDEEFNEQDINNNTPQKINKGEMSDIDLSITGNIETFIKNTIIIYTAIVNNCKNKGPVYIEEVITHSSFKYKIYGPGLTRPIDVFNISFQPIRMIKTFHVNCVKMYYTDNLYMLRSCVSTLLSGVSETYNWISCNKIALQIFFKYIQKGFTIIFKKSEQKIFNDYIINNEKLNKIMNYINIKPEKMYCSITSQHIFFRPHLYGGIRENLKIYSINVPYVNNILQIPRFNPITKRGNIKVRSHNKLNHPNYNLISF